MDMQNLGLIADKGEPRSFSRHQLEISTENQTVCILHVYFTSIIEPDHASGFLLRGTQQSLNPKKTSQSKQQENDANTRLTERLLFLLCCSCLKKSRAAENRSCTEKKERKNRKYGGNYQTFSLFSGGGDRNLFLILEKTKHTVAGKETIYRVLLVLLMCYLVAGCTKTIGELGYRFRVPTNDFQLASKVGGGGGRFARANKWSTCRQSPPFHSIFTY